MTNKQNTTTMSTYSIGQQVQHSSFGNGTVTSIEGPWMVINFTESGVKRVMAAMFKEGAYAPSTEDYTEEQATSKKSIPTASDIFHGCNGVWEPAYANMMAEIAAKATGAAADIAAKAKQYHSISIKQAAVLASVAKSNNITF